MKADDGESLVSSLAVRLLFEQEPIPNMVGNHFRSGLTTFQFAASFRSVNAAGRGQLQEAFFTELPEFHGEDSGANGCG